MIEKVSVIRKVVALVGVALIVAGARGLYNLRGARGDLVFLLQLYPLVGVLVGVGLLYGASRRLQTFRWIVVRVLGGGALFVLATSLYTLGTTFGASGELVPFFEALGFFGSIVGVSGIYLAWKLERASREKDADR